MNNAATPSLGWTLMRYAHGGETYDGIVEGDAVHPVRHKPAPGLPPSPGEHRGAAIPLSSVVPVAPVTPGTVFGMAHNTGAEDRALPPQAFLKATASVTSYGQPVVIPRGMTHVVAEAELAVVIGREARNLAVYDALDAVAGYTVAFDITDAEGKARDPLWTEVKSRDTFTPLGPWLVTGLDPSDVHIELTVDGVVVAAGRTSELARTVPEILAYLSSLVTLRPGDVVLTGAPGSYADVRPGSVITATAHGIGSLMNPVVAEGPA